MHVAEKNLRGFGVHAEILSAWLDITLLLLIPTSGNMDLDWEAPSHSEDMPILAEGCSVGKGRGRERGQREFCLCTVDKKHFFFPQQNPCVSLGVVTC